MWTICKEEQSLTQICTMKTRPLKPVTKEAARRELRCHDLKEQKQICLDLILETPEAQHTPTMHKVLEQHGPSTKPQKLETPVMMGRLAVLGEKGMIQTKATLLCIHTISIRNPKMGRQVTNSYYKMA